MYVSYAHPFLLPATVIYYGLPNTIFPERDGNFFSLDRVCGGANRFAGRSD